MNGLTPAQSAGPALTLFADEKAATDDRQKRLMIAMDSINWDYGPGTVRLAPENAEAWKPNQTMLSPHYTTAWSDLITVNH